MPEWRDQQDPLLLKGSFAHGSRCRLASTTVLTEQTKVSKAFISVELAFAIPY